MNKLAVKFFIPFGVICIVTALILPGLLNCDNLLSLNSNDQKTYLKNHPEYKTIIEANDDCNNSIPPLQLGIGLLGMVLILMVFLLPLIFPNMDQKEEKTK